MIVAKGCVVDVLWWKGDKKFQCMLKLSRKELPSCRRYGRGDPVKGKRKPRLKELT